LWIGFVNGQNQGNLWFLGDSIGLDFNVSPTVSIYTPVRLAKMNIATISDSLGNLRYYDQSISTQLDTGIAVFDKMNNKIAMTGGTKGNYFSFSWFLDFPTSNILGYLVGFVNLINFNHYGKQELNYSKIDTNLRNGLGDWTGPVNMPISIFDSLRGGGGVALTRNANGRDWWVVGNKHLGDSILVWLATPDSMYNIHRQKIGSNNCTGSISPSSGANGGQLVFNFSGDRLLNVNGEGLVEIFDFDRCSGILSNSITLDSAHIDNNSSSYHGMYSADFSPTGRYVYACQYDFVNSHYYLVQYDIEGSSPGFNKTIIFNQAMNQASATRGFVSVTRGLDNRMYLVPRCTGGGSCFPIDSTCLSTIENPDIGGLGCGLYLNKICYNQELYSALLSLAPNYDLGPIDGSLCDTLGIDVRNDTATHRAALSKSIGPQVYPNPAFLSLTLEMPEGVQILSYKLFDIHGRCLLSKEDEINSNINLIDISNLTSGAYLLEVETDSGLYREKVVVLSGY
jgi:hypothetical protein